MTKPTSKPEWTDSTPANRAEPTTEKKGTGYLISEKPGRKTLNWILWIIGQWINWFESITDAHETSLTRGIAPWSATRTYMKKDIVIHEGSIFSSFIDNNSNNIPTISPPPPPIPWIPIIDLTTYDTIIAYRRSTFFFGDISVRSGASLEVQDGIDGSQMKAQSIATDRLKGLYFRIPTEQLATTKGTFTAIPLDIYLGVGVALRMTMIGEAINISILDSVGVTLTILKAFECGIDSDGVAYTYTQTSITTYTIAFTNYGEIKSMANNPDTGCPFTVIKLTGIVQNRGGKYQYVDTILTLAEIGWAPSRIRVSGTRGGFVAEQLTRSLLFG